MSILKRKFRRFAAGAGALSCATAALLAVGGLEAGSAQAACSTTFVGRGSALQRVAQTLVFEPAWEAGGCGTGANAKVSYGPNTGSGLREWGYLGSGLVNTEVPIIGSDVGPTAAQISNARSAGHGADAVIVPVTQTAIAVVVHPPAGCTLTQITNAHLDEAFSGKATTWAALGGSGTCTGAVTRVVAVEGAGDTYQFKNYLAKIRGWTEGGGAAAETQPCTGSAKWSELESLSAGGPPNTSWPECGTIPVNTQMTGIAVAEKVAITAGTIGYAGLPDAKAKSAQTVNVQDGSSGGKPIYAGPASGEEANCRNAKYTVPSAGLAAGGTGLDVDWSQVFGGNPTIGGGTYSICALTYDLGWHSYAVAGFGSAVGAQVKAYYEFILSHKLGTTPYYYANLPTGGGVAAGNVQGAAEFAVSEIN